MPLKIKGLYLRGNSYWYRQTVNGRQIRTPLKASSLAEAAQRIKDLHQPLELEKDEDSKGGLIYLVQCHEFYKIGITQDIDQRVSDFTTSNPHPLTLLKTWTYKPWSLVKKIERMLHRHYASYHHRGEWFKLPPHEVQNLLSTSQLIQNHCSFSRGIELTLPK